MVSNPIEVRREVLKMLERAAGALHEGEYVEAMSLLRAAYERLIPLDPRMARPFPTNATKAVKFRR